MIYERMWRSRQQVSKGTLRAISSYLLVFLIPFLAVSWIWYETSVQSINEQVMLTAKNQLIQLKYSLENNFIQLNYLSQKMTGDHLLSLSSLQHPYYTREAKETLQTYKITNEFVEEVYLYYKEQPEYLFSSVGKFSFDTFLEKVIPSDEMNQADLVEQLESAVPTLLTINSGNNQRHHSRFFYIVPLRSEEMTVYGAAIYEIKEASLRKMLDISNSDGASTNYLVSDEYQILASTNNNELSAFLNNSAQMKRVVEQQRFRFQQQNYLVQEIPNADLAISVVSVTNSDHALATVNRMQMQFVVVFFGILIGGSIAVILLGMWSYRPMQKIEHLVRQFEKEDSGTEQSIQDIHHTLETFLVEHQELHKEIQLQTPHAREQVLRKLMGGRFRSERDLALLLDAVHIKFPGDNYFVVTIDAKTVDSTYRNGETSFLIDYIEEIKAENYSAYATEILSTEMITLTVGFSEGSNQEAVVQAISDTIAASIGLIPAMGVGSIVKQLTAINESYIEGLAALDYHISKSQQIVYYLDTARASQEAPINYPDSLRLKLVQALNQGNDEVAIETIHGLIQEGQDQSNSIAVQRMYGYYLLNNIAQTGGELVGSEILQIAAESADFRNLNQLEPHLFRIAKMICEQIQARPQNQESEMNEKIFTYIAQNFHSSQLSLESVAEEVGVSVSYISRFVKKESGKTFSKYIQELRLKKIQQELVETNLPIKQIIRENGYYDVSNYTRKFRTIVGVTPGQYRSLNQTKGTRKLKGDSDE